MMMNGEVLKKIYKEVIEKTNKKYISLQPCKEENSIFNSKLGGVPYTPKMDYYIKNKNLCFLGQLNFKELPYLNYLPEKGILQFFISKDENKMWGASDYKEYKVIYYENIDYSLKEKNYKNEYVENFPIKGEYRLRGRINYGPITVNDYRFNDIFMKIYKEYINSKAEGYWEIEGINEEEVNEIFSAKDIRCGGNPAFIQDDIRQYEEDYKNSILLFQVPSILKEDINISWGDSGIANFFINSEDLRKKNFYNTLFSWDCY